MIQLRYGGGVRAGANLTAETTAMKRKTAKDLMSHPVLAVRGTWTVRELASWLVDKSISGAPVLDDAGHVAGVVSLSDIADQVTRDRESAAPPARRGDRFAHEELRGLRLEDEDLLVRDIMTPTFFTVPDTTTVPVLARTMVAGRIHRLLVTRKGRVVGIVTTLDLLRDLAGSAPSRSRARPPRGSRPS